jgi:class 3 adenylate cyclase
LRTSKEVLERTGISRATLNNYIGCGIVPKPDVLPPEPQDGAAPRIGYFPDSVIQRIDEIQRLKKKGWSITRISEHFLGTASPDLEGTDAAGSTAPAERAALQPAAETVRAPAASAQSSPPPLAATSPVHLERAGSRKRMAALTQVAVVAMDLQHSGRLWSELPAHEYFELVDEIWLTVAPIFGRHAGSHGKHPAEGLVGYFMPQGGSHYLWNALLAALEVREAMRHVSRKWQLRKGWATELHMNTGIDEGHEWSGTLKSGSQAEFIVFGDAVDHAMQISNFSHSGAVWATRNLVGKLNPEERRRLKYGVHRRNSEGHEVFVPSIFSRVEDLPEPIPVGSGILARVAQLPITEIVDVAPDADGPDGPAGRNPI